jgi:hypothetical protein
VSGVSAAEAMRRRGRLRGGWGCGRRAECDALIPADNKQQSDGEEHDRHAPVLGKLLDVSPRSSLTNKE